MRGCSSLPPLGPEGLLTPVVGRPGPVTPGRPGRVGPTGTHWPLGQSIKSSLTFWSVARSSCTTFRHSR